MGEEKFLTVMEHGHLEHALIRKEGDLPQKTNNMSPANQWLEVGKSSFLLKTIPFGGIC